MSISNDVLRDERLDDLATQMARVAQRLQTDSPPVGALGWLIIELRAWLHTAEALHADDQRAAAHPLPDAATTDPARFSADPDDLEDDR